MERLIDADKLLEETRRDRDYARKNGFLDMYYERQVLIDRIKAQPTAYNVDKIVEQLESLSNAEADYYYARSNDVIDREDAIEIVKQGCAEDDVCEWRLCDEEANVYDTSCRNPHILIEGTPRENNYKFCPYCGKKIKVVE